MPQQLRSSPDDTLKTTALSTTEATELIEA